MRALLCFVWVWGLVTLSAWLILKAMIAVDFGWLKEIQAIDAHVMHWINDHRKLSWIPFFLWMTQFGTPLWLLSIVGISSWLLYANQKIVQIWQLWGSFLITATWVLMSKYLVDRPRPIEAWIVETTPSFPSWHAALTISVHGLLTFWVWRFVDSGFKRNLLLLIGGFFLFATPLSRLVLNVHYLSDVIAGIILGGLGVWLSFKLVQCLEHFAREQLYPNPQIEIG